MRYPRKQLRHPRKQKKSNPVYLEDVCGHVDREHVARHCPEVEKTVVVFKLKHVETVN